MLAIVVLGPNLMVIKKPYSTSKALGAKLLVTISKLLGSFDFRHHLKLDFIESRQYHLSKLKERNENKTITIN